MANCIAIAAPALFQSTRPVRGATALLSANGFTVQISIHAPRAGRDHGGADQVRPGAISIHAPRAGRDSSSGSSSASRSNFNPRAPCGARPLDAAEEKLRMTFQSTRPVRGATVRILSASSVRYIFQSTRPVRGATNCVSTGIVYRPISIHAPRAGRDAASSRRWPAV